MLASRPYAVHLLAPLVLAVALTLSALAPAGATIPRGDTVDSGPAPDWGWEVVFHDGFDGPAGLPPEQWHTMLGQNAASQDGQGHLDVARLAQVRTNPSWALPVGTQVRVTASLLMPDTGTSYAAFWVQHPTGDDPRELDVIESYGPLKPAGAQLASHLCYDDTPETAFKACVASGLGPLTWPVTPSFPVGAAPWNAFWEYSADFTIGADTVLFTADDGADTTAYAIATPEDARRVPSTAPFHLRFSNKALAPEHVVPGGTRETMLVDWVTVEVKYPDVDG